MNGEKLWKVSFLQHIMSFYKFPFPFPVHVVFTACSFNMIINNPQSSFNCFLNLDVPAILVLLPQQSGSGGEIVCTMLEYQILSEIVGLFHWS